MMKKLLVLMLVLGMATMANAALTITISGPTELETGATGTYTIEYSGITDFGGFDFDAISDTGTLEGMWNISSGAILAANYDTGAVLNGKNEASGNYELSAESFTLSTPVDMGSPLASFVFTAPSTAPVGGIATLSLISNGLFDIGANEITGITMPTFAVTIPEPMTIGLLGLGGLFLRRRK
jgi:hypothetical protein